MRLGIPHIEADALFWRDGRENPGFLAGVAASLPAEGSWIYEGHFGKTRALVTPLVTEAVWLDPPYAIVLARWLRRSVGTRDFGDWRWVLGRRRALRRMYAEAAAELAERGVRVERRRG